MIDYTPEEAEREKREQQGLQRYRNVFGTPEGRKVLGDILQMCHFGVPLDTSAPEIKYIVGEYNIGIAIARMSGIMSAIDQLVGIEED